MEIEGTYTLRATPEEVWHALGDRQTLLDTIPEVRQLERVDEFTHALALHLNYAPLTGTYYSTVRLADKQHPQHVHLILESARDTQDTMSGEATLRLVAQEDTTVVTYQGDVMLHKAGTQLQRTVIKGAIKLLIQQFFTSLEEHLWQRQADGPQVEEEIVIRTAIEHIPVQSRTRNRQQQAQPVTLLQRIVHLLRLGRGDTTEEMRWTQRIRRTGYASMLLFLVWVGTRIVPRR